MDAEDNIPVVLDSVDFDPPAFFGFTNGELVSCVLVLFGLFLVPFLPFSSIVLGNAMYGFVLAGGLAVVLAMGAAKRAEILKKDRPSYMMWIDLKRRIQDDGILGMKYNYGLVKSQVWDTASKRNG